MAKVLTDALLKAVRRPAEGRIEIADTRKPGLAFRITASGAKSWTYRFRDPQSGKNQTMALACPAIPGKTFS